MQKMNYEEWKEAFIQKVREYIRSVPELENRGTVEVQTMSYINGEKIEGLAMNDFLRDEDAAFILENSELGPLESMFVLREKDSPFGASVIARQDILETVGEVLRMIIMCFRPLSVK